jgi:hypothetical protein
MGKIKLLIIVGVLLSSVISKAETICVQNVPQYGDQTCTTTTDVVTSVITNHTTNNFLSGDFTDGSWNGTNLDHTHGSGTIAGVGGEYVQSTLTQADSGLSDDEVQRGFSSTIGADIWFWDRSDTNQSVTMTQIFNDGNGDVTTQNRVVDYANNGYNTYQDTIVIGENNTTNGSVTARFDFTHTNTQYHRAADLKNPTLTFDYTKIENTTSQVSNTTVDYCFDRTPNTCPQAVEDIADTIVDIEDDLIIIFEEIEAPEIDLPVITYEPETIEVDEPEIEIISVETVAMLPDVNTVPVLTVPVETTVIEEEITTEELIDAYDTEPVVETTTNDVPELETNTNEELPTEEVAMVEQEPELDNGEVVGEETMPLQEESAVPVSDESTEIAEEEIKEETIEEEAVEEEVKEEEVEVAEETVEETTEVNPKMVAIEEYIDSKIDNELQKIEATLTVVSELVSREMKANQVDISSYANINQAIFNIEQLPDGNKDFFNQIALVGYDRDIYTKQVSLSADDPVVKHTIELNNARKEVNTKYNELRELINARNGI